MNAQSYTKAISVDNAPKEAFAAINNVRGWWSENIEAFRVTARTLWVAAGRC